MRRAASALLLALAGCKADPHRDAARTLAGGVALAQVQAALDRERQCLPLLSEIMPLRLLRADPPYPGVAALTAAELIEVDPTRTARSASQTPYRPTAAGRRFMRFRQLGDHELASLCYGRRRATRVWLAPRDGETDLSPQLRYAFRVVDRPAWTHRPDIRAAFPWLDATYDREHRARDLILWEDEGRWRLTGIDPYLPDLPGDVPGFSYCPRDRRPHPPPCDRVDEN